MARRKDHYSTKLAEIDSADTLCKIARPIIRSKAKRLCRRPGFTCDDCDDIEQTAHARLLERFATGEGRACPVIVFIKQIVGQSMANQVRDRFAQKRDCRSVRSLNIPVSEGDEPCELADVVDQSQLDARLGRLSRSAQEMVEMGIDLEETIARFSREQQELCRALGVDSISEIARRFQQPRTTVQDRVRSIRRAFETASRFMARSIQPNRYWNCTWCLRRRLLRAPKPIKNLRKTMLEHSSDYVGSRPWARSD